MEAIIMAVIFVELNELNFDLIHEYLDAGCNLPNLEKVTKNFRKVTTLAEQVYEYNEPWIQWVSVHTGLPFSDHQVFRLGDANAKLQDKVQIFELLEQQGMKVGAVSPMNAVNKLKSPAYFIPDPWTDTMSDSSKFSKRVALMLKQTINDNTKGTVSKRSILTLLEISLKTFSFSLGARLLRCLQQVISGKKWYKALILDHMIHKLHLFLLAKHKPDVSFIFLNSGAHIQHHYMLNSIASDIKNPSWYLLKDHDPVLDMLFEYDVLVGDYLNLSNNNNKVVFATGLSQEAYKELTFYYRLKSHKDFLKKIGVKFLRVNPRMTRDFEILFESDTDKTDAVNILRDIKIAGSNEKLFGEISNGAVEGSLFVTLTYPNEITTDTYITLTNGDTLSMEPEVGFVAIKNGKHSKLGYLFYSPGDLPLGTPNEVDVHEVYKLFTHIAQK